MQKATAARSGSLGTGTANAPAPIPAAAWGTPRAAQYGVTQLRSGAGWLPISIATLAEPETGAGLKPSADLPSHDASPADLGGLGHPNRVR